MDSGITNMKHLIFFKYFTATATWICIDVQNILSIEKKCCFLKKDTPKQQQQQQTRSHNHTENYNSVLLRTSMNTEQQV